MSGLKLSQGYATSKGKPNYDRNADMDYQCQ
jgi:hypothetical protein